LVRDFNQGLPIHKAEVTKNTPMFGPKILLQNITDILSSSNVNTNSWLPFVSNNSFTASTCSVYFHCTFCKWWTWLRNTL